MAFRERWPLGDLTRRQGAFWALAVLGPGHTYNVPCTCTYVDTGYACVCVYIYISISVCVYIYIHISTSVHLYIYIYTHMCVCVCVCVYLSIYLSVCLSIHIYIYTHIRLISPQPVLSQGIYHSLPGEAEVGFRAYEDEKAWNWGFAVGGLGGLGVRV